MCKAGNHAVEAWRIISSVLPPARSLMKWSVSHTLIAKRQDEPATHHTTHLIDIACDPQTEQHQRRDYYE